MGARRRSCPPRAGEESGARDLAPREKEACTADHSAPRLGTSVVRGSPVTPELGGRAGARVPMQSLRPRLKTPPRVQLRLIIHPHRALLPAHKEDAEPRGCWPELTCSLRSRSPSRGGPRGPRLHWRVLRPWTDPLAADAVERTAGQSEGLGR